VETCPRFSSWSTRNTRNTRNTKQEQQTKKGLHRTKVRKDRRSKIRDKVGVGGTDHIFLRRAMMSGAMNR
jgi:hypothetical protein